MCNSKILKWQGGQIDFSNGTVIMGILNVTPDSFSDGGLYDDAEKAIEHGLRMAQEGASIIDVGGESTRPGSASVSIDEQIRRVVPVIDALSEKVDIPISIDTKEVEVAQAALDAGGGMINDITALADESMKELAVKRKVPVVLMHMQGEPATMQVNPTYEDVVNEVLIYLLRKAEDARQAGIVKERIFIDPGIGFGKTFEHNLILLRHIEKFIETGYKVLIGTSRKGFIGAITSKKNPEDRIFGTAATVVRCVQAGVHVVRVHDIGQMNDVIKMTRALRLEE